MKKTFQFIFTMGCVIIFGLPVSAETFKKGDKVFSKETSHFTCVNYDRMKARQRINILLDIEGCEIADFEHSGFPIGKVARVKDATIAYKNGKRRTVQLVEVKTKKGKKWFATHALSLTKASKKVMAMDWFFNKTQIGETFNSEVWEKHLGKYEILSVSKRNHHEAYYFPLVDKTVAVNILRNNRISYTRNGKNPN